MRKHEDNPEMHILKTATCKSTSGKSTLTYQIGALPDTTVHIRISKNTGAGFFNDEWVAVNDIRKALADGPEGQPLTSFLLEPLLQGRSANTPAFLMAALCQLGCLRVLKGKKRGHELLDSEGFDAKMQRLVTSKAKPKGAASSTRKKTVAKKAPSKKATVKKRIAARRKQEKVS